jgi:pimeloyl-ACP methyl ester carboxylesterase
MVAASPIGQAGPGIDRSRSRTLPSYSRAGLVFDVRAGGPGGGVPVVLLHGWPGGAGTWSDVEPELHRLGFATLTPDQRGYSPGARPQGTRSYAMGELVDDVVALLDGAEAPVAHLVGHDWGGAVGWAMAASHPDRLASLTVLSTPHPRAMARSLRSSDQALRSAYVAGFQLPILPERLLLARRGAVLRTVLRRSGLSAERAEAYVARQLEPGALTASLAWYRALRVFGANPPGDITVPTRYVWSTRDTALGRRAAELTADHVRGPYHFEVLDGVSHWIPEECPALVASLVAAHAQTS